MMVLSTLNRTLKAYALAIVGAEYILRWLPIGTHQWDRFVTPAELARRLGCGSQAHRHDRDDLRPFADEWRLGRDIEVNYLATATK